MAKYKNRLSQQTSPYLQQHAQDPVDWYPWGEEAFAEAKKDNKPIFLSIGYSACHWCHVMAHESFSDPEIAAVMNAHFVNIKVDKEERPDLDRIYQTAHQLLTQRTGGWPLTLFLNPENQLPFFAGTYFPKEAQYGLPDFKTLLNKVSQYFHNQRQEIEQQNETLQQILHQLTQIKKTENSLNTQPILAVREAFKHQFDSEQGGFGTAPKFPQVSYLDRLMRHYEGTLHQDQLDETALVMLEVTLTKMAEGGIYDQLGGGFYRYSVDNQWRIPHFEKMLYDNAQLLAIYSEAYQVTGIPLFKQIAEETADFLLRDMKNSHEGFYASLDADSEGIEGKFYYWEPFFIREHLNKNEYIVFSRHYGLDQPANFEEHWHLYVNKDLNQIAKEANISPETVQKNLQSARKKLLHQRENRARPGKDIKILTAWNALAIKGLAIAGNVLKNSKYMTEAQKNLDFIHDSLWENQRLFASYQDDKPHLMAYLDDYVFLIDAILQLLQIEWRTQDLQFAKELADTVLTYFLDKKGGGFFFTAHDHEALIQRPKNLTDNAIPSGNGIAAQVFLRLGYLLGEERYIDAAKSCLEHAWTEVKNHPEFHCSLLNALEDYLNPPDIVIIRGNNHTMKSWLTAVTNTYAPRRLVFAIPGKEKGLPNLLAQKKMIGTEPTAYVCRGTQCSAVITDLDELIKNLKGEK